MESESPTVGELIRRLNLLDENERIEAKRGSEIGNSFLESVCAFSNEPGLGGGWILLGVATEEATLVPTYEVLGVDAPDRKSADIASQCASVFNSPIRPRITTEEVQGKPVILVYVPEATPVEKPIFFVKRGLPKGAFRRIGSTDQRCNGDDLVALYQGHQQESFDAGIVEDADTDDFLPDALADYRNARAEANPDAEELAWSDDELLQALNCTRRGRHGERKPTVAGLLLFGTPQSLRRCFPMTRVDYIRVDGRQWVPDPDKRFDTVEIRAPLLRLIRRAQAAVIDDLPRGFQLREGELQRADKPLLPQRALREALVNALMHRNYRSHSPVQIIRYANRLEIRNPGFSLKSPEHLGEPGSSPRNPNVAAILHETRFAETKGSGIRAMRTMTEAAGLAPPLFESNRDKDEFVVKFLFHHLLGPDDLDWLSRFKCLQLSDSDIRALVVVRESGVIDNATFRDLNKVDVLQASVALRKLRDAGLLEQQGRGPATWYRPTAKLLGSIEPTNPEGLSTNPRGLSTNPRGLSTNPRGLSTNPEGLSTNPKGLSTNPEGLSSSLNVSERARLLNELPREFAANVEALGRRASPDEVKQIIVAVCSVRAWKAEELATLIARNARYLRVNYLRPLLRDRYVEMTSPENPNDPDQAYFATNTQRGDE